MAQQISGAFSSCKIGTLTPLSSNSSYPFPTPRQPWNPPLYPLVLGLWMLDPWKKSYDITSQCIKKQTHHLTNKGPSSQSNGFSSSHVWIWELDHKESWAPKNWCFWITVLEKTLESLLNFKEIKPVNPKRNQSWIFIGRTDAEAETPILWPPDAKSRLIGKDPDDGKDWRQEEKGTTEDEMVVRHHQLMSIELVMPSNHLILCHPLLMPSIFPSNTLIQWVGSSHQVTRVLELQLQLQSFQWIYRVDFLWDWLAWSPCN